MSEDKTNKNLNNQTVIRNIVAIGIGAAVFFILKRFVTIPTGVPNTDIATAYPFLALLGVIFGPWVAGLAGFIGHTLGDVTTYGAWWTWIIGSGLLGVAFGFIGRSIPIDQGIFGKKEISKFVIGEAVANIVVWAIIAPIGDILIYSEPANKVFLQGIVAGLTNAIVTGIIGVILLKAYASTRVKKGSLKAEK